MKKIVFMTLLLSVAGSAWAQNTGTVTVQGSVQKAAALRWWDFTANNAETGTNADAGSGANTVNDPLSFTLDVGDVAAGNNLNDFAGGSVDIALRSNSAYELAAQVTSSSGFGTNSAEDIVISDIGFGITGLAGSGTGAKVNPAAITGSSITVGFSSDPTAASTDADGEPTYDADFSDLSASTTVLTGPRISYRGGRNSPNNALVATTAYAVVPQYYTPTAAWAATVTYTLTTP